MITNNKIVQEGSPYQVHSFSLSEDSQRIVAELKKLDPDLSITSYTFWVDEPFYNYLLGESK
ncbi:hypothetical protein J2S11_000773 [Bacillus horti]|uniref:Uncharacterized protein n=1 Tax=Caldalkalibacillus horti TaxID=77523 RepID=A0ABT9VV51_9BACI|nr:hypothetical protein [Bacillus horti]